MQSFCSSTLDMIEKFISDNKPPPYCLDQPFIIYNALKLGISNNILLSNYAQNIVEPKPFSGQSICHFPTTPGDHKHKIERMVMYLRDIRLFHNNEYNINNIRDDIIPITISNKIDYNLHYILSSSNMCNINVKILGTEDKYKEYIFIHKLYIIQEYLQQLTKKAIVIITDGWDVFYKDNLDIIKQKFLSFNTDIVFSTEKQYEHQLLVNKFFYDNLCTINSKYKYLNTGTYIGYSDKLLELINDAILYLDNINLKNNIKITNNQSLLSGLLKENYFKYNFKFDYNSEIFYIPTFDWFNIDEYLNSNFKVNETGSYPSIIHVPFKARFEFILKKLYFKKFNYLVNNTYTWQQSTMTFTENGIVKLSSQDGEYLYINSHIIIVFINNIRYLIKFDNEYKSFISIQFDNLHISKGIIVANA